MILEWNRYGFINDGQFYLDEILVNEDVFYDDPFLRDDEFLLSLSNFL